MSSSMMRSYPIWFYNSIWLKKAEFQRESLRCGGNFGWELGWWILLFLSAPLLILAPRVESCTSMVPTLFYGDINNGSRFRCHSDLRTRFVHQVLVIHAHRFYPTHLQWILSRKTCTQHFISGARDRRHLVADIIQQIHSKAGRTSRKPLKVRFIGGRGRIRRRRCPKKEFFISWLQSCWPGVRMFPCDSETI
jgi:hypothetical protein